MEYLTAKDYKEAEENGISHDTFRRRIDRGWSKELAKTKPKQKKVNKKPYLETAAQNGIPEYLFNLRVYKLRWSRERAATDPVRTRRKQA